LNHKESAETIALRVLTWLIAQEEEFPAFLNHTGATVDQLAHLAQDPVFLGAVLDFLLEHDARVKLFCDQEKLDYLVPMRARMALPGGDLPHWT
jgi:hypothetical protein